MKRARFVSILLGVVLLINLFTPLSVLAADNPPTVVTYNASSITQTSATLNAEITANGGALIIEYGFCWGKNSGNPENKELLGTNNYKGSISRTITGLTPGTTYYFYGYAKNSVGKSSAGIISFTTIADSTSQNNGTQGNGSQKSGSQNNGSQDTERPILNLTSPSDGSSIIQGDTFYISATASDNVGVAGLNIYVDGTSIKKTYSGSIGKVMDSSDMSIGTHEITVNAVDAAGNVSSNSVHISILQSTPSDNQAPVVSISSPSNGAIYTQGDSISITATATDNVGVAGMNIYIDGNSVQTSYSGSVGYTLNTNNYSIGTHTIKVNAVDAANNVGTNLVNITINPQATIDTQPPVVSINSPSNGAIFNQGDRVTISATATDNVGVTGMNIYVNGSSVQRSYSGSDSCTLDTSSYSPGTYTIMVTAVDAANNVGTLTVQITINGAKDIQPPVVSINSPSNGATFNQGDSVTISATATDNVSVTGMNIYLNGSSVQRSNFGSVSYTLNTTNYSPGTYTIKVNAVDTANNVGTKTIQIIINVADTQGPVISINNPSNGASIIQGATVSINATATDNTSVSGMGIYLDGSSTKAATSHNGSITFSWNTTGLSTGSHTIRVTAADLNNKSSEKTICINVPSNDQPKSVSGTVRDNNGSAVSQALVYIGDQYAYTSSNGSYTVNNITPGSHNVSVSKDGYTTYTGTLNVTGNLTGIYFTLSGTSYYVSGTVKDSNGSGLSGALVYVGDKYVYSSSGGGYTVTGVSSGNHNVSISKDDYTTYTGMLNVTGNLTGINFTINGSVNVGVKSVTVTSSSGTNRAGDTYTFTAVITGSPTSVSIFFDNPSSGNISTASSPLTLSSSNSDGTKTYVLPRQISTPGNVPSYTRSFQVKAIDSSNKDATYNGTFTVNPPLTYAISGAVKDSAGKPVADAMLNISGIIVNSDSNGNYSFLKISAGSQTIIVSKTGYKTQTETINVTGNISWQNFTLQMDNSKVAINSVKVTSSSNNNTIGDTFTFTAVVTGEPKVVTILFDNGNGGWLDSTMPLSLKTTNPDGTKNFEYARTISSPGPSPDFARKFRIFAADASGNLVNYDGTFTVKYPTFTVLCDSRNFTGNTVTLRSDASSSFDHVYYYLVDTNKKEYAIGVSKDSQNKWSLVLNPYLFYNGTYTLAISAADAKGNVVYGVPICGVVFNTPELTILPIASQSLKGIVKLTAQAKPDMEHVYYYLSSPANSNQPINVSYSADNNWSASFNTTSISNGTYVLKAAGADYAKNKFDASNQITITVQNPMQINNIFPVSINIGETGKTIEIYGTGFLMNNGATKAISLTLVSDTAQIQVKTLQSVSPNKLTVALPDGLKIGKYSVWIQYSTGERCQLDKCFEVKALPAISNLTADYNEGAKRVELSWSPVVGASSYIVYRTSASDGKKDSFPIATTYFYDSMAKLESTYYYAVVAVTSSGNSGAWPTQSLTVITPEKTLADLITDGMPLEFKTNQVNKTDAEFRAFCMDKIGANYVASIFGNADLGKLLQVFSTSVTKDDSNITRYVGELATDDLMKADEDELQASQQAINDLNDHCAAVLNGLNDKVGSIGTISGTTAEGLSAQINEVLENLSDSPLRNKLTVQMAGQLSNIRENMEAYSKAGNTALKGFDWGNFAIQHLVELCGTVKSIDRARDLQKFEDDFLYSYTLNNDDGWASGLSMAIGNSYKKYGPGSTMAKTTEDILGDVILKFSGDAIKDKVPVVGMLTAVNTAFFTFCHVSDKVTISDALDACNYFAKSYAAYNLVMYAEKAANMYMSNGDDASLEKARTAMVIMLRASVLARENWIDGLKKAGGVDGNYEQAVKNLDDLTRQWIAKVSLAPLH